MLWSFGRHMFEFEQGCLEIFWHGDVKGACRKVPVNGESVEEGTNPVDGDGMQFWRSWMRWASFSLPMYLTPKSSTTKEENDGLGGVIPERWGSGNKGKVKMDEVSLEPVVGNEAGLFEAGHASSDI